jgi:hypothetical protein
MAGKNQGGGISRPFQDGYRPGADISTHGYKPTGTGNPQGGHVPTTSQGGSNSTPPNQGSGGKK